MHQPEQVRGEFRIALLGEQQPGLGAHSRCIGRVERGLVPLQPGLGFFQFHQRQQCLAQAVQVPVRHPGLHVVGVPPAVVRVGADVPPVEAVKEPKRTWHGAMRVSTAAVSKDSRYTGASLPTMASAGRHAVAAKDVDEARFGGVRRGEADQCRRGRIERHQVVIRERRGAQPGLELARQAGKGVVECEQPGVLPRLRFAQRGSCERSQRLGMTVLW